ncbi:MAG: hypothetical protein ACT4PT_05185 [Methanobacteriota archaeon]
MRLPVVALVLLVAGAVAGCVEDDVRSGPRDGSASSGDVRIAEEGESSEPFADAWTWEIPTSPREFEVEARIVSQAPVQAGSESYEVELIDGAGERLLHATSEGSFVVGSPVDETFSWRPGTGADVNTGRWSLHLEFDPGPGSFTYSVRVDAVW